jgi:hypothetical protein
MLSTLGFLVAIPGALVDMFFYFDINGVYGAGTVAEQNMLFTPAWSQIVAHWRLLLSGIQEAVTRPSLSSMGLDPIWDTAIPIAFLTLALAPLIYLIWSLGSTGKQR